MPDPSFLTQGDPTGFSSPLGQVVVLMAALLASLAVLVRCWLRQRGRRTVTPVR